MDNKIEISKTIQSLQILWAPSGWGQRPSEYKKAEISVLENLKRANMTDPTNSSKHRKSFSWVHSLAVYWRPSITGCKSTNHLISFSSGVIEGGGFNRLQKTQGKSNLTLNREISDWDGESPNSLVKKLRVSSYLKTDKEAVFRVSNAPF